MVQEKSSLRGKVSLQCSASGKTIRWNGKEETRSMLLPLFFFFSLHHLRKGLQWRGALFSLECRSGHSGEGSNVQRMWQNRATAHAPGAPGSQDHAKNAYLLCICWCVGVFSCLEFLCTEKLSNTNIGINPQQLPKLKQLEEFQLIPKNRFYQVCVAVMKVHVQ